MKPMRGGTTAAAPNFKISSNLKAVTVALVGNPNSGKTTLFNALTGLRHKVGNYPGVTVERKEGMVATKNGDGEPHNARLIDLPGLYSLTPHSPDEVVARDALLGYLPQQPRPDAIVNVVDAANLERNLFLTTQLLDLGIPMIVALTMTDTASEQGVFVDAEVLGRALGVPVRVVTSGNNGAVKGLADVLGDLPHLIPPSRDEHLPTRAADSVKRIADLLRRDHGLSDAIAPVEATLLLAQSDGRLHDEQKARWSDAVRECLAIERAALREERVDVSRLIAEARYDESGKAVEQAERRAVQTSANISERIDRFVLHRFWGYVLFVVLMYTVFQGMFTLAAVPQDWIRGGIDALGNSIMARMPEGDLRELLVQGILGGVGNSIVFLPQILLLSLFISLLEDTGYLARAAFLVDRLMSRVGLHGKSFIPLLSSYACAIPGIMATRTIDSPKARILTILIAPLMSCSARLPVYALMIGTFIPKIHIGGVFYLPTLMLFGMYALGTVTAFGVAALFNKTLLKSEPPSFLMEMPPYRLPHWRSVLYQMGERAWLFLQRAGTFILSMTILLWFLSSYPKLPNSNRSEQLRHSFAGQIGHFIEPTIAPLGFDWKIGIGLISSFAAREVFVSSMGTIYNLDDSADSKDEHFTVALGEKLKADRDIRTGRQTFTPLVAVALMVYYVLAMQCMSTVAVVRRETGGWKWPLFQIAYMSALAWAITFLVYQGGKWLGFG